jgi:hypothetical protein
MPVTNESNEERNDDPRDDLDDDDYNDELDWSWHHHPSLTVAQRNPSLR